MARKPKGYRPKKWRKYKKKGRSVNTSSRSILPLSYLTRLPYQETVSMVPGAAGIPQIYVFRLNSLFDPNFTGVGHQPRGFDQLVASDHGTGFYNHYLVCGAKFSIRVTNQDSAEPVRFTVAFKDTSPDRDMDDYLESSTYAKSKICGVEGSGRETQTIVANWSAKKWFQKPNVTTERDLMGNSLTNPTEVAYLHIVIDSPLGQEPQNACAVEIKASFASLLTAPVTPGQS